METITIEVGQEVAKHWDRITPKLKTHLAETFAKQIEAVSQNTDAYSLDELIAMAREEAKKNGLTEERLQQLLNED